MTPADKLAAVERELRFRRRVYPGLVRSGKMTTANMEREIAVMEAIADDYREQVQGRLL